MRVKFIEGTNVSLYSGVNCVRYVAYGKIHWVVGCYVHKQKQSVDSRNLHFIGTQEKMEKNTIYIVKQKDKICQFRTLVHELCHWVAELLGNSEKLHKFIDTNKYLK